MRVTDLGFGFDIVFDPPYRLNTGDTEALFEIRGNSHPISPRVFTGEECFHIPRKVLCAEALEEIDRLIRKRPVISYPPRSCGTT